MDLRTPVRGCVCVCVCATLCVEVGRTNFSFKVCFPSDPVSQTHLLEMAAAAQPLRILALTGSLRKLSANSALLRFAQAAAPALGAELLLADVALPLFDADVEAAGLPEPVRALRALAASCGAVILATPEYNYSMSPVTSNAIAWLSRAGAGLVEL